MKITEARKLRRGEKVKQKMHGYVLTVEKIEESFSIIGSKNYVIITCITDNGDIMKHNHKELLKI